nr:MAG TPA: hypothetical protein [Caudoviricetes sp.]
MAASGCHSSDAASVWTVCRREGAKTVKTP